MQALQQSSCHAHTCWQCDKTQPTCLRCEKLGKPCPGYDKKRKFVDEGVTLRKKYQGSNDRPSSDEKAAASPVSNNLARKCHSTNWPQRLYQATVQASSSNNSAQPDVRSPATTVAGAIPLGASPLAQPPSTLPAFDAFNNSILAQRNSTTSGLSHGLPTTSLDPATEAMLLADPPVQIPLTNDDTMLDALWKNDNFDPEFFDLQPDAYYSAAGNTCGFLPNIPEIVDEVDQSDILLSNSASGTPLSTGIFSGSFSDSNLWAPESQLNTSALITSERDHEMAYLIRHFTESIGPW